MASAEYVQGLLLAQASGFCDIETQEFKVPVWAELEAPELSSRGVGKGHWIHYQNKVDFQSRLSHDFAGSLVQHVCEPVFLQGLS